MSKNEKRLPLPSILDGTLPLPYRPDPIDAERQQFIGYKEAVADAFEMVRPLLEKSKARKTQTSHAGKCRAVENIEQAEKKYSDIRKRATALIDSGRAIHELAGLIAKEGYSRRVVDRVLKPMRDAAKKSRHQRR